MVALAPTPRWSLECKVHAKFLKFGTKWQLAGVLIAWIAIKFVANDGVDGLADFG